MRYKGQESELKTYSVGIVARTKLATEDVIFVYPIEVFPDFTGEVMDEEELIGTQHKEMEVTAERTVTKTFTIPALFDTSYSPNRATAPDVVAGETVFLTKYADSDRYWWRPRNGENDLRRLETVVYNYGNTSEEGVMLDVNNSWSLVIDPANKEFRFRTTMSDGEEVAYDIQINTKENWVKLKDTEGNFFDLHSIPGNFSMHMNNNINFDCKNFTVTATDDIRLQSGKDMFVDAGGDFETATKGDATHQVDKNAKYGVGETLGILTGENLNLTSKKEVVVTGGENLSLAGKTVNIKAEDQLNLWAELTVFNTETLHKFKTQFDKEVLFKKSGVTL